MFSTFIVLFVVHICIHRNLGVLAHGLFGTVLATALRAAKIRSPIYFSETFFHPLLYKKIELCNT